MDPAIESRGDCCKTGPPPVNVFDHLPRYTLLAPTFATAFATPALAEVCDDLRPNWDGKELSPLNELPYFLLSPLGVGLLCLWLWAWYRAKKWVAYPVAIVTCLALLNMILETAVIDPIMEAIQVGCMGSYEVNAVLMISLSVLIIARAHWKT